MDPNADTTNDIIAPPTATAPAPKKRRGFGAKDPDAVAIARKGGLAAHARGRAHRFTPEEARSAGRKGGYAAHRARAGKPAEADAAAKEEAP
jgi:general stress protein YciG